jgi:dynein light intermediate chain
MERQARKDVVCPVREELWSQCLDEIIMQVTFNELERRLLLLNVKLIIAACKTLVQS